MNLFEKSFEFDIPSSDPTFLRVNPEYKEILKLEKMLSEREIPHELRRLDDGWQVIYAPINSEKWVLDAIETRYSYGSENDLIEIAGKLLTKEERLEDSAVGHLTAEAVFKRIREHWYTIYKDSDVNWIV